MSDIRLVEIPAELLAEMRERVWFHTASLFAVERSTPVYKGTGTLVAVAKKEYLLTAAHVWRELRGDRFALSLEADRLLVPIQTSLVEPIVLTGTDFGEWGPDLALIRIPDLVARDIRQVKAFYNVDKRDHPLRSPLITHPVSGRYWERPRSNRRSARRKPS